MIFNKKQVSNQYLKVFLKTGVAFGLIYWLIQSGRFDPQQLHKLKSLWVWVGGGLLFTGVLFINSKRWQILLNLEGVRVPYGRVFSLSLIGLFFNFFIPGGGAGGDLVKAGFLMGDFQNKKWFIGWSVLVDRVFGVLALLFYSAVTGFLFNNHLNPPLRPWVFTLSLMIFLSFILFLSVVFFLLLSGWFNWFKPSKTTKKILYPLFLFSKNPGVMGLSFLLSLMSQALLICFGVLLFLLLKPGFSIGMVFLLFPISFLSTILPISPAGLGVGQISFHYFFEKFTGFGEFGFLTITFLQAVQFLVSLAGGLLFILYKKKPGP